MLIRLGFVGVGVVGSLDQEAFLERRSGADEGDEVGGVHGSPAGLGGLDELEGHRHAGCPRAGHLGGPRTRLASV